MTTPNLNRRSGSEPPRQRRDSIEELEAKLEEAQKKLSRLDKVNSLIQENHQMSNTPSATGEFFLVVFIFGYSREFELFYCIVVVVFNLSTSPTWRRCWW